MKGFHLLVWRTGQMRVFGDGKHGYDYAEHHIPELDGKFSLWAMLRVWWWVRKGDRP